MSVNARRSKGGLLGSSSKGRKTGQAGDGVEEGGGEDTDDDADADGKWWLLHGIQASLPLWTASLSIWPAGDDEEQALDNDKATVDDSATNDEATIKMPSSKKKHRANKLRALASAFKSANVVTPTPPPSPVIEETLVEEDAQEIRNMMINKHGAQTLGIATSPMLHHHDERMPQKGREPNLRVGLLRHNLMKKTIVNAVEEYTPGVVKDAEQDSRAEKMLSHFKVVHNDLGGEGELPIPVEEDAQPFDPIWDRVIGHKEVSEDESSSSAEEAAEESHEALKRVVSFVRRQVARQG